MLGVNSVCIQGMAYMVYSIIPNCFVLAYRNKITQMSNLMILFRGLNQSRKYMDLLVICDKLMCMVLELTDVKLKPRPTGRQLLQTTVLRL